MALVTRNRTFTRAKTTVESPANHTAFGAFYNSELLPKLNLFEKRRLRRMWAAIAIVAAMVLGSFSLLFFGAFGGMTPSSWLIMVLALLGMGGGSLVFALVKGTGFREDFKREVVARIAKFVDPTLEYRQQGISQTVFDSTRIYTNYNRYRAEDRFRGKVGDTEVDFCELNLRLVTGIGKNRRTRVIFNGYYFTADFSKNFHGTMLVLPDTAESALGWIGQKLQEWNITRPGSLVKLEDAEFERLFVVYATDQVEARYILSPSFMKRLSDFFQRTQTRFSLAFVGSKLHLTFPRRGNQFEPPLFQSMLDMALYQSFHDDIRFFLGVVDDLNLNLRIWDKMADGKSAGGSLRASSGA